MTRPPDDAAQAAVHEIGFDPESVLARDSRVMLQASFLTALHAELARELGPEQSSAALLQMGFLHGLQDVTRALAATADARPGLRGIPIPLPSRIILVADTVEAMTSDRPYRKALSLEAVVSEIQKYSGTQFDPKVTEPFLRLLEREGESFIKKNQKFDIYSFIQD